MKTPGVQFATKALTFTHEVKYMCMNTCRYVLETFKLLRIIGRDMFFNQFCIMHGVKQGDNSEIQNAVFSK